MSTQERQRMMPRRARGDEEGMVAEGPFSTQLTCFLLGGAVGALVALLFAPKSGRELRGDIADVARKGADTARERAGEFAQTARQAAARRTETLSAAIDAGKRAYSEEKRRTESSALMEPSPNYNEGQG